MHIEVSENNPLYAKFNELRLQEGYTTFKSAIIQAMKMFIENVELEEEARVASSNYDSQEVHAPEEKEVF